MIESIATYDRCLKESIKQHEDCKRLLKLEGVGVINAVSPPIYLGNDRTANAKHADSVAHSARLYGFNKLSVVALNRNQVSVANLVLSVS